MTNQGKLKVFLCHANENEDIVRNLYLRLKAAGYEPWLDTELIFPGMSWEHEIQDAIQKSDAVIICLSATSITKEGYFHKELKLAQNMQEMKPEGVIFLIPLRLDNSKLPPYLQRIHWGDYTAADGFEKLVHSLNLRAKQLGKSSGSSSLTQAKSSVSRSRRGVSPKHPAPVIESNDAGTQTLQVFLFALNQMRTVIPANPFFEFGDDPQIMKEMETQLASMRKLINAIDPVYSSMPLLEQRNPYYEVVGAFENLQKFIGKTASKVLHSTKDTNDLKTYLQQLERATLDLAEKQFPNLSTNLGQPQVSIRKESATTRRLQRQSVDVVILTVLEEEYLAISNQLQDVRNQPGTRQSPNIYAWKTGIVFSKAYNGNYRVMFGMTGKAGNLQSAIATYEAIDLWSPRYLFFSGIAGGLFDFQKATKDNNFQPDIRVGDAVIAEVIHGYEYGKVDATFHPRDDWTYETNRGLWNKAIAYKTNPAWQKRINSRPPRRCKPNILGGQVASGDKVIDDPTNAFFSSVYQKWPKAKAVEMEGAGVGAAIRQAGDRGKAVGFLMVRGISDVPRPPQRAESLTEWEMERGTLERDKWKLYAAEVAAAVTVGLIAEGLPSPPKKNN